jgi:hypothetical protein
MRNNDPHLLQHRKGSVGEAAKQAQSMPPDFRSSVSAPPSDEQRPAGPRRVSLVASSHTSRAHACASLSVMEGSLLIAGRAEPRPLRHAHDRATLCPSGPVICRPGDPRDHAETRARRVEPPTTMFQRVRRQEARASTSDANPSEYKMPVGRRAV